MTNNEKCWGKNIKWGTSVPDKNVDFFQVNFKLNAFLKSVTNQYILPFYKQKWYLLLICDGFVMCLIHNTGNKQVRMAYKSYI